MPMAVLTEEESADGNDDGGRLGKPQLIQLHNVLADETMLLRMPSEE